MSGAAWSFCRKDCASPCGPFERACGACIQADRSEIEALTAERDRLQKLFDDAGQGEHNVLALVDHYQDATIEETRKRYAMGALLDEALGVLDENGYCEIADDIRKRGKDLVAPHMERGLT
jgi:hypothetical protein